MIGWKTFDLLPIFDGILAKFAFFSYDNVKLSLFNITQRLIIFRV